MRILNLVLILGSWRPSVGASRSQRPMTPSLDCAAARQLVSRAGRDRSRHRAEHL